LPPPWWWAVGSVAAPAAKYPRIMTPHFDEDAARRRLQAEKDRMQGLIRGLHDEGLDQDAADQVGDLAHVTNPADQASETFEREKDVAILDQLERDLAEIEAALQRLDDGTYGIDEVTGEPIAPERLDAYPAARTNIESTSR
jgi:RNA polymerase-binding transcription factor DksA